MIEDKMPPQISLSENEEVKMVLRRQFISILISGIVAITMITLIIGIIFYSFLLNVELFLYIFLIPLGTGIFLLILLGYPYTNGHRYVITNRRIIIYKKFIFITTRDIPLINVTDLILAIGVFGRIFNYGSLLPVTAGLEAAVGPGLFFQLSGIKNTVKVRNELLGYMRATSEEGLIPPPSIEYVSEIEEPVIPQVKILPDEKVILLLKRKYWSFFFKLIWPFGIFLGLFIFFLIQSIIEEIKSTEESNKMFIYSILTGRGAFMSSPTYPYFIFSFILAILTIIFGFVLIFGIPYVRSHRYYVTDRRLILFKKFVWITYREVFYEKITDLLIQMGPFARLLNYGGLRPITAGMEFGMGISRLSIEGIPNAQETKNKIIEVKRHFKQELY